MYAQQRNNKEINNYLKLENKRKHKISELRINLLEKTIKKLKTKLKVRDSLEMKVKQESIEMDVKEESIEMEVKDKSSYWSANFNLNQAKNVLSSGKTKCSNVASQLKFSSKPISLVDKPNPKITSTFSDDENLDESKIKLSNDMSDACKTPCKLCNQEVKLFAMRNHTKTIHNMSISEYKSKFGKEYEIIEKVYHKCRICGKIILLCSDSVAEHLKTLGHKLKDPNGSTTHKNYNEKYMMPSKNKRGNN